MKKEIELLIELQEKDGQVADLEEVLVSIPINLLEKEKEVETIRIKSEKGSNNLEEKKKQLRHKERELLAVEEEAKKFRAHFHQVKTQKEAEALDHEIKKADNSIETLTEEILLIMDEIAEEEKNQAKKKEDLEGVLIEFSARKKKASADTEEIEKEVNDLKEKRRETAEKIDESLLSLYEKIRKNKDNLALSRISGDSCGACSMKIRSQLLNEVKEGAKIIQCENCLRILYI
ncbi:MAG: C4-type zinc ribbon domain-containing protein [bacterium]|nr:C4-type zinc ribbon domain-containing protein [bacterium]